MLRLLLQFLCIQYLHYFVSPIEKQVRKEIVLNEKVLERGLRMPFTMSLLFYAVLLVILFSVAIVLIAVSYGRAGTSRDGYDLEENGVPRKPIPGERNPYTRTAR